MTKTNKLYEKARKLAAKATKKAADQRIADTSGRSAPPEKGKALLRLVGYAELGEQVEMFQGRSRVREKVRLVFELVNRKKHPPIEMEDGTVIPRRMKIDLTNSLNKKATLFQLKQMMDPEGEYSHIAQMIGMGFIGRLFHHKFTPAGSNEEVTVARLKPEGGSYTLEPAFEEDDDGDMVEIDIPEALSEPFLFFWDEPDLDQWDSLYIEGEYSDGRSRNVLQETIRRAVNWEGSPAYEMLEEDGRDEEEYEPLEPTVAYGDGDESPGKASKKPSKKSTKKLVEDEDEDEAEEEEEEPKPRKKKAKKAAGSSRNSRLASLLEQA